jgi:polar amino acid transport system substrate-binding protein
MRFDQVVATIVISLLAGTIGAFLILLGHLPNAKPPVKEETALERVVKSGTLQCGYAVQPPFLMKDPNTNAMFGLWYELTEKIAALNNLKVVWVTTTTAATLVADLRAKKFDVFCGGWPIGGGKSLGLIVSAPVHYSALGLYGRVDDQRLAAKPDFLTGADVKFAIRADTPMEQRQQLEFPTARVVTMPADAPDAQAIEAVFDNKADVALVEQVIAAPYLQTNPAKLKAVAFPTHVPAAIGRGFALLPEDAALRDALNVGMQAILGSDFIDKEYQKYAHIPGMLLAVDPGYNGSVPPAK